MTYQFERFLGRYEDDFEREHGRWRRVVEAVVARYLECGVLKGGCAVKEVGVDCGGSD